MLAQINPLTFVYGAFAAMFLALGWVKRAHRVSLWLAAGLAASGAASAYFHAFWPMVMFRSPCASRRPCIAAPRRR